MNRGNKDSAFFEKWSEHRHRYYTKKATCAILAYSSTLLFVFINMEIVIYPHLLIPFILFASLGIIFVAIYLLISNPPTTLDHQATSIDESGIEV